MTEDKMLALQLALLDAITVQEDGKPPTDVYGNVLTGEKLARWEADEEVWARAERAPSTFPGSRKNLPQSKPGRNDPCRCGSGKKHKKCCGRPPA